MSSSSIGEGVKPLQGANHDPWGRKGIPEGPRVYCEAQGGLFHARLHFPSRQSKGTPSPRGPIHEFSRRSRKRLLDSVRRLSPSARDGWVFLTLTYPAEYPTAKQSKRHLAAFFKRLGRRYPDAGAVWGLEFQDRGAPHYHVILYGLPFVPKALIQSMWGDVIGFERPFTRIEYLRSVRGAVSYASKYLGKPRGLPESGEGGLDYVPYSAVAEDDGRPGRFWGMWQGENLPWGEACEVTFKGDEALQAFYRLRRLARRAWRRTARGRHQGFTLWRDYPEEWLTYIRRLVYEPGWVAALLAEDPGRDPWD